MPLYTFYPILPDNIAATSVAVELPDDARAMIHAENVATDHPSALRVEVFNGDHRLAHVANPFHGRSSASADMELVTQSRERIAMSREVLSKPIFKPETIPRGRREGLGDSAA